MKSKLVKKYGIVLPMFLGLISCGESKEEIAKKERQRLKALFDKEIFENGVNTKNDGKFIIKDGSIYSIEENKDEKDLIASSKGDEKMKDIVKFLESLVKLHKELSK